MTAASKYAQPQHEVAASVSVITREDIRTFGWRTLGEALASLPGFHTTYDRLYTYIGARGLGVPGDYKPGVAAIYRDLEGPCWPVATNSGAHWPAHGFRRYPGTVVFEFLEPIPAQLKRGAMMALLESRIETASLALLEPKAQLAHSEPA